MKNAKINISELNLPGDLKKLSAAQCDALCFELRKIIIETAYKNGGHLSSNLGAVELTVAIHRAFNSPDDKIIWDVGHQSYAHKLVTGRVKSFATIRRSGGISGFCRPDESEHDAFISGHSSVSVSASIGIARAMRLSGNNENYAVAVIGDGALTGGQAYEGFNNVGRDDKNLIVILNDNNMSISKNVGAIEKYLTSIRGAPSYLKTKKTVEDFLNNVPFAGESIKRIILSSKSALKYFLYHSTMFEDFGFAYLGPVDGHNIAEIEKILNLAKRIGKPAVVHLHTVKGKGFVPAEQNPGKYHGISADKGRCFSHVFGDKLLNLAESDKKICAVTAAMKHGTGLRDFARAYKDRFFDVGIAEQHAVTFCAGLAKGGMTPVFAVYSSFLQRCYDQLIHDVSIDGLHVVLGVDRAGFVGGDGDTHQGIFDVPMLTSIPGATVFSPSGYEELELCLEEAVYNTKGLAAVRFPKDKETVRPELHAAADFILSENGSDKLAISYGRSFNRLYEANRQTGRDLLKLVKIWPLSDRIIKICLKYKHIIIFEESAGGISGSLILKLSEAGYKGGFRSVSVGGFPGQSSVRGALKKYGLDISGIEEELKKYEA